MYTHTHAIARNTCIKIGSWVTNCLCKNTGRYKFGNQVGDHHKQEIVVDSNLAVVKVDHQTTKFFSYTVGKIYMYTSMAIYEGSGTAQYS